MTLPALVLKVHTEIVRRPGHARRHAQVVLRTQAGAAFADVSDTNTRTTRTKA